MEPRAEMKKRGESRERAYTCLRHFSKVYKPMHELGGDFCVLIIKMKKALDSMPALMCVGQLVKKLEPKTLRRGPWNEQKSGQELWVSTGHSG